MLIKNSKDYTVKIPTGFDGMSVMDTLQCPVVEFKQGDNEIDHDTFRLIKGSLFSQYLKDGTLIMPDNEAVGKKPEVATDKKSVQDKPAKK